MALTNLLIFFFFFFSLRERKKDNDEDELNLEEKEPFLETEREKRPRLLDSSTILMNPPVGRQTNNSLSSATGKIVIQNRRTKLKSSQMLVFFSWIILLYYK